MDERSCRLRSLAERLKKTKERLPDVPERGKLVGMLFHNLGEDRISLLHAAKSVLEEAEGLGVDVDRQVIDDLRELFQILDQGDFVEEPAGVCVCAYLRVFLPCRADFGPSLAAPSQLFCFPCVSGSELVIDHDEHVFGCTGDAGDFLMRLLYGARCIFAHGDCRRTLESGVLWGGFELVKEDFVVCVGGMESRRHPLREKVVCVFRALWDTLREQGSSMPAGSISDVTLIDCIRVVRYITRNAVQQLGKDLGMCWLP